jgi:hypothetical protein
MAKREKHFHQLRRHSYKNGESVYFCVLNCRFKCHVKLSLGKIVACNTCGQPFEMNTRSARMAKPTCDTCSKKSPKAVRARREKEIELGKPEISIDDLNLELPELKGLKAPKVDPLDDLQTRMDELKSAKPPVPESEVEKIEGEDDFL